MNPRAMRAQAREFARRGWVAVSFMRRGYGESEGQYAESSGGCANPDYRNSGRQSAQDLRGVIAAMKQKPYVDASRIVSVGRSAGGFATLALTADPPAGLVAAINFAAGRGSQKPDEVCQPDRLVEAFGHFGRTSRIPTLWVYSENDHYFNPKLAKRFHQAFTGAGGRAELVIAAPFGEDGHSLFSEKGAPVWTGLVDPFLARHELKLVDQLLPLRDEASVHYPKGLGARGKEAFLKYLDEDGQKAFAMSRDGFFGWRSRQKNAEAAIEGALENCRKVTQDPCTPVMINDRPVQ
jgi:dienelactone hydrolase